MNPANVSKLLIQQQPLQVLPDLAIAIGLNEAIVLQQLYWLLTTPENGKTVKGKRWIYNTYEQWHERHFRFWSTDTIKRTFRNLEKLGVIDTCQPEGGISRRKYYRVNESKVSEVSASVQAAPVVGASCPHGQGNLTPSYSQRSHTEIPPKDTLSRESDTPLLRKGGSISLKRGDFSQDELDKIDIFHEVCVGAKCGFLPITKRTPELKKVLEMVTMQTDDDYYISCLEAVKAVRSGDETHRTMVRVCWANY